MMKFVRPAQSKSGFTLIEVLVVIGIVGLLSAFIAVNAIESGKQSRDVKRQSDLRAMQSQIELYKNKWGRYPEQCLTTNSEGWSGQLGTQFACSSGDNRYILGNPVDNRPFSEFMVSLPQDERLNGTNSGYVYRVNTEGTVYKIMAMRSVEAELVSYNHPLKSCDIRPDNFGRLQNLGANGVLDSGWCTTATLEANDPPVSGSYGAIPNCRMSTGINVSDNGNGRFERSYGLWGGFEPRLTVGPNEAAKVKDTALVICR